MTTAGSQSAAAERHRLIVSCQGLVRSIAWKVHQRLPPYVDLEELVSSGQVGLAEAARDFDAERGGQFSTYAWYRIRGAILDGLSRMKWFDRGDFEGGRYDRMANEALADAGDGSQPQSGPPENVIARQGGWLKGVTSGLAVACLASRSGMAEGDIADSGLERPDDIVIRREVAAKLRECVTALPADMATLVRATYFQGKTLTEAAADLGISKAWASRLHARALGRLAAAMQAQDLDG